ASDHRVLAPILDGVADAGRMRDLGGDGRGPGDDPKLLRAPVGGHLASTRGRILLLAEDGEKHVDWPHACDETDAHVPVVGDEHVVSLPKGPCAADLTAFVAGDGYHEG